jgi:hypothetical protein
MMAEENMAAAAEDSGAVEAGADVGTENIWDFTDAEEQGTVEGAEEAGGAPIELEGPPTTEAAPAVASAPVAAPAVTAPTQAPAPVVAPVAAPAPTQQMPDYATWKADLIQNLATKDYALSPEDAVALQTEPEVVLPQIAARLHMQVLEHATALMGNLLPGMVERHANYHAREHEAKNLFTQVNPDLADEKYIPVIFQLGQAYRQVNPTASAQEASKAIGLMVRNALGIAQQQATQAPAQVPRTAQQAPARVTNAPFAPVRRQLSPQTANQNVFTSMAEDWGEEY